MPDGIVFNAQERASATILRLHPSCPLAVSFQLTRLPLPIAHCSLLLFFERLPISFLNSKLPAQLCASSGQQSFVLFLSALSLGRSTACQFRSCMPQYRRSIVRLPSCHEARFFASPFHCSIAIVCLALTRRLSDSWAPSVGTFASQLMEAGPYGDWMLVHVPFVSLSI